MNYFYFIRKWCKFTADELREKIWVIIVTISTCIISFFVLFCFVLFFINYGLWWNSNNATLQTLLNSSDPYRSHYCVSSDKKKVPPPPRSGCVLIVMYRRPLDPKTLTLFYTDPYMAFPPRLKRIYISLLRGWVNPYISSSSSIVSATPKPIGPYAFK